MEADYRKKADNANGQVQLTKHASNMPKWEPKLAINFHKSGVCGVTLQLLFCGILLNRSYGKMFGHITYVHVPKEMQTKLNLKAEKIA